MFREHLECFNLNNIDMARNMEENVRKLEVSVVKEFTANRFQDSQALERLTKFPRVRSNIDNFYKHRIVSKLSFECTKLCEFYKITSFRINVYDVKLGSS